MSFKRNTSTNFDTSRDFDTSIRLKIVRYVFYHDRGANEFEFCVSQLIILNVLVFVHSFAF